MKCSLWKVELEWHKDEHAQSVLRCCGSLYVISSDASRFQYALMASDNKSTLEKFRGVYTILHSWKRYDLRIATWSPFPWSIWSRKILFFFWTQKKWIFIGCLVCSSSNTRIANIESVFVFPSPLALSVPMNVGTVLVCHQIIWAQCDVLRRQIFFVCHCICIQCCEHTWKPFCIFLKFLVLLQFPFAVMVWLVVIITFHLDMDSHMALCILFVFKNAVRLLIIPFG